MAIAGNCAGTVCTPVILQLSHADKHYTCTDSSS